VQPQAMSFTTLYYEVEGLSQRQLLPLLLNEKI
jgi:hypothetical protein